MQVIGTALHILQALWFLHVDTSTRRVCYLANWAQYRQTPEHFTPVNINHFVDPHLCSHIILAFLSIENEAIAMREWNDQDMIDALIALKVKQPRLKVMVAIGGWNEGTERFSKILSSEERMRKFAREAVLFLRNNHLDGLDLDFEYPANRGSPPEDRERFTRWLQIIAEVFEEDAQYMSQDQDKLILSSAVGVGKSVVDSAYEAVEIFEWLDFVTLMTYDMHGAWEKVTGHNAPLRTSSALPEKRHLTVEWAVHYWLSKGVPANKINLGIPTYGRSFRLDLEARPFKTGIDAVASEAGPAGIFTSEPGFNAYFETCLKQQCQIDGKNLYDTMYDEDGGVPYMYSHELNDWIGIENATTVKEKTKMALDLNLGGVAVWTIDYDDCANWCGQGHQPLLHAINEAINPKLYQMHNHHIRDKRRNFPPISHVDPCERLVPASDN